MKNLKTILLGLFAIISSTEITYPIFGTRRPEAYVMSAESKKNEAAAYQAGMMAGSKQDQNSDSDLDSDLDSDSDDSIDDVANQRASRREDYEFENFEQPVEIQSMSNQSMDEGNDYIDPDFAQNYADDATVAIQAMQQDDDGSDLDEDSAVDQALKDAGLDDDFAAATQEQNNAELNQENVAIQAVEAEVKHEDAVKPVDEEIKPASTPAALVAKVDEAKQEEIKAPVVQATHVAKADEVKIVKVYPMYDAVRSAIKGVHSATQDMLNYMYSFITIPAKPAVVEVKAPVVEVKIQSNNSVGGVRKIKKGLGF